MLSLICFAILAQTPADDAPLMQGAGDAHASQQAFDAGIAAYAAKDYDTAIASLERSYQLVARADALYAWAQAERLRGNCVAAVPLYERFIDQASGGVEAGRAREQLDRCRRLLPTPWYRDWIGHGLTATGVVALAAGTAYFSSSQSGYDDARAATTYPAYDAAWSRASDDRRNAIIGWSAGGALVAAGITHYVWFALHQRPAPVALMLTPSSIAIAGDL